MFWLGSGRGGFDEGRCFWDFVWKGGDMIGYLKDFCPLCNPEYAYWLPFPITGITLTTYLPIYPSSTLFS